MRFVLLGSGRGSNAEAILRAWQGGCLGSAEPVALFSDRADSRFLTLGPAFGLPASHVDPGPSRAKFTPEGEARWRDAVNAVRPDLVVLVGFMRILPGSLIEAWGSNAINLHPSLLPSFKGLDGIRQAWNAGVKITGCTVHRVTPALDGGPILDQTAVRIEPGDTLESLEAKVHAAEHDLMVKVLREWPAYQRQRRPM